MHSYVCELGDGQRIDLENSADQTIVTALNSRPGQQQQSSSQFQTGRWTAPPEAFRVGGGVGVRIVTAQGTWVVLVQGSRISMLDAATIADPGQTIPVQATTQSINTVPPIAPMPPLPPLKMGDMEMDSAAMTMKMGNMQMSMTPSTAHEPPFHPIAQSASASKSANAASQRRFCGQCGTAIKPGDRFCAHCGHRLD